MRVFFVSLRTRQRCGRVVSFSYHSHWHEGVAPQRARARVPFTVSGVFFRMMRWRSVIDIRTDTLRAKDSGPFLSRKPEDVAMTVSAFLRKLLTWSFCRRRREPLSRPPPPRGEEERPAAGADARVPSDASDASSFSSELRAAIARRKAQRKKEYVVRSYGRAPCDDAALERKTPLLQSGDHPPPFSPALDEILRAKHNLKHTHTHTPQLCVASVDPSIVDFSSHCF